MLKQTKLILLLASITSLPLAASAGIFSNPYNHYYVDVGGSAYYLQHPKFEVGTVGTSQTLAGNTTAPLAKINLNDLTPQFHLAAGYWFMNCSQNWISKIFGHEEAIELDLNYLYFDNSVRKSNLGLGNVWKIDGSGSIFSPNTSKQLTNFKLSSKLHNFESGVYFKGKLYTTNPRLTLMPYVGIVYDYYYNEYKYSVNYSQGEVPGLDTEDFTVSTHYYGPAFGGRLNFAIIKQVVPFADLEVRFLAIHSNLDAKQKPNTTQPDITVTDSESTFSYEAIAALGVEYKFTKSLKSPSLTLKAGVDHWNYVPCIVPPNRSGDKAVHLHGESMNNGFAMLNVHIPFG